MIITRSMLRLDLSGKFTVCKRNATCYIDSISSPTSNFKLSMVQRKILSANVTDVTDALMRKAAFEHVEILRKTHGYLTSKMINDGFIYQGRCIPLRNQQQGIFKPRQMRYLLSVTTVFPRGSRITYDDQNTATEQFYKGSEAVDYAFMGTDPKRAQNQHLLNACKHRIPIIYFLGFKPGIYHAITNTYISDWDADQLNVKLIFDVPNAQTSAFPNEEIERRYAMRMHKQRLHQTEFREAVITAYGGQCAITRLAVPQLLDAAHIIPDKDKQFGQPVVTNGFPLSKTHHAAYDRNLIGIDPDYRLHVSDRLLIINDGPMLESLKQLKGNKIVLPRYRKNYPDRDRLAQRFEEFQAVA